MATILAVFNNYRMWLLLLAILSGLVGIGCAVQGSSAELARENTLHKSTTSDINTLSMVGPATISDLNSSTEAGLTEPETTQPDLWQIAAQNFVHADFDAGGTQPAVSAQIEWLKQQSDFIYEVTRRSEPYAYYVMQQTIDRQLPAELMLLPMVESAYDGFAYSPGQAAGLWQFIPSTGKHFGLQQNWWYDGRRDIVASTTAAMSYLQQLYRRFESWELALAAYNAGPARIARAQRKNRSKGLPDDYWSLELPAETQRYVPRLQALREVLRNPEAYGMTVYPVANAPYFEQVNVGSQIDLAQAADMANIPVKTLYRLNPGLNRWASPPQGPHQLALPVAAVKPFIDALSLSDPDERIQWQRYKVKSGDTLSTIAQRHNSSQKMIMHANSLHSSAIRAGAALLIPVASESSSYYALSKTQREQNIRKRGAATQAYKVREGDSWWIIAKRFNVSVAQLTKWNASAPADIIRPGQQLTIRKSSGNSQAVSRTVIYTVKRGDNLSKIAQRFKVSVGQIKNLNKKAANKYLQPGQVLKIVVAVAGGS
jgi:membrane-bound lytic murein transglycosylase D